MSKSLKIAHRGSNNTRVELPDQTTTVVPNDQLPLWELVHLMANDTLPASGKDKHKVKATEVKEKKYLRIRRTGKYNVCLILPDYTKTTVSIDDLPNWEQVEDPNQSGVGIMDNIEKKCIRIKCRGKINYVLELPDHSLIKIPKEEISQWEVADNSPKQKEYLRVRRTGKFNVGVELPDHSFYKIPVSDFPNWVCVNNTDTETKTITEKKYLNIKHRGKNNYRLELLDHSFISVPKEEVLSEWEQVGNQDSNPVEKKYLRVLRTCKKQVRIELPDFTTRLIPKEELSEWTELYTLPFPKTETPKEEKKVSVDSTESMSEEIDTIFNSPILESNQENKKVECSSKDKEACVDTTDKVVMDPILGLSVVKEKKTMIDEVGEFENIQIHNIDSLVDNSDKSESTEIPKKRRGRPKKVVVTEENKTVINEEENKIVLEENKVVVDEENKVVVDEENKVVDEPVKKRRGRPRKNPVESEKARVDSLEHVATEQAIQNAQLVVEEPVVDNTVSVSADSEVTEVPKKRRGRPRKNPVEDNKSQDNETPNSSDNNDTQESTQNTNSTETPKKRCGRPRKNPIVSPEDKEKKRRSSRRNSVLNEDHPYESVNMDAEPVEYSPGVKMPF